MRRLFAMIAGLAVAIPAAMLTMVLALTGVAIAQGAASALPAYLLGFLDALAWSDQPNHLLGLAFRAAGEGLALVCCAPVICAALIGQVAGLARPLVYAVMTAALTALLPLAALNGSAALGAFSSPVALSTLLLTGAVAGFSYGAVGAPHDGRRLLGPQASASRTPPGWPGRP